MPAVLPRAIVSRERKVGEHAYHLDRVAIAFSVEIVVMMVVIVAMMLPRLVRVRFNKLCQDASPWYIRRIPDAD